MSKQCECGASNANDARKCWNCKGGFIVETADYCETHGSMWRRADGSCGKCAEVAKVRRVFPVTGLLSDEEQLGRAAKHELEKRLEAAKPKTVLEIAAKPDLVTRLRECIDPMALEAADEIERLRTKAQNTGYLLKVIAELARQGQ